MDNPIPEKNIPDYDMVAKHDACPSCGERDMDRLVWLPEPMDDTVECLSCGAVYRPGEREGGSHASDKA